MEIFQTTAKMQQTQSSAPKSSGDVSMTQSV
jgi:hypothetical protein